MIRRLAIILALAVWLFPGLATDAAAAPVEIVRVWTGYRLERDYVRIAEILSGRRFTGGTIEHRTAADSGDGFFFTVRVDRARALRASSFTVRLAVIGPEGGEPVVHTFPIAPSKKRGVRLELGLTGADWPHGDVQPLAWCVDVLDASGALVATRRSFLWEKPPR